MTEGEWLSSSDPQAMARHAYGLDDCRRVVSDRKLRLIACACVRQVWHLLADGDSRRAVEVAERYADGLATVGELDAALCGSHHLASVEADSSRRFAEYLASNSALPSAWQFFHTSYAQWPERAGVAPTAQADILRDIVGNPYQAVRLSSDWLTADVVALAHAAYDLRERKGPVYHLAGVPCRDDIDDGTLDPVRLSILADALEEAGCCGELCDCVNDWCPPGYRKPHPLIAHLRSPGPHWRGCWAIDILLERQ